MLGISGRPPSTDAKSNEIQQVVRRELRAGRVRRNHNDTYRVEGRGQGNRIIEVIYVLDDKDELWDDDVIYVIHAMPLTPRRRRGGN